MSMTFITSLKDARAEAIIAEIGTSGYVLVYSGTKPAVVGGVPAGTLLGQLNLSPIAGTVTSGVTTFNPIANDISADASGYVTWGRIHKADGTAVIDFDCGSTSSNATMKFTNTLFATGDTIAIDSFVIVEGN